MSDGLRLDWGDDPAELRRAIMNGVRAEIANLAIRQVADRRRWERAELLRSLGIQPDEALLDLAEEIADG